MRDSRRSDGSYFLRDLDDEVVPGGDGNIEVLADLEKGQGRARAPNNIRACYLREIMQRAGSFNSDEKVKLGQEGRTAFQAVRMTACSVAGGVLRELTSSHCHESCDWRGKRPKTQRIYERRIKGTFQTNLKNPTFNT